MKRLLLVSLMLALGLGLQACNMNELLQPQQKEKKSKCILDNLHTGECEMYSDEERKNKVSF